MSEDYAMSKPLGSPFLNELILALSGKRGPTKSICPSEVARLARPNDWRRLMPQVREAANALAAQGSVLILQGGRRVDPTAVTGPIRIRIVDSNHHSPPPAFSDHGD